MTFNDDDFAKMQIAGTVSFPAIFPRLADIRLTTKTVKSGKPSKDSPTLLEVREITSIRVSMTRYFNLNDVRAVFVPNDANKVSFDDGVWLFGEEISGLKKYAEKEWGKAIAYVTEQAQTLLEVRVGMTAAESAEYYPPLPRDRSINHYSGATERDCLTEQPASFSLLDC